MPDMSDRIHQMSGRGHLNSIKCPAMNPKCPAELKGFWQSLIQNILHNILIEEGWQGFTSPSFPTLITGRVHGTQTIVSCCPLKYVWIIMSWVHPTSTHTDTQIHFTLSHETVICVKKHVRDLSIYDVTVVCEIGLLA